MRLINTTTLELEDHFQTIPQYAILSHTWGGEEVSLQDWLSPPTPARRDDLLSLLSDLENPAYDGLLLQPFCELAAAHKDWVPVGPHSRLEKFGYWKIIRTCLEARKDGLNYLWVDTNCIDKTSSAELSEAINSMYTWYRNAAICYAYLSDVPIPDPADTATCVATEKSIFNLQGSSLDLFRRSRWFRRGWTLQELLAPMRVRFYSRNWTLSGPRRTWHHS